MSGGLRIGVFARRGGAAPALLAGGLIVIGAAVALLLLPPSIGLAVALLIAPVTAIAFAVLRKPLLGVLLVYVLEYFRPQDLVAALQPLRIPMIATLGVFGLFLIHVIRDPRHRVVWPRQATTLAVLLAFMALSVFTSTNTFWAFQFFRGMVVMVMLFLLTVNFVGTKREFNLLIGVLVAAHAFLCFKGIAQFLIGNAVGTTGVVGGNFLGDENDFALALVVIFPFAYFAAVKSLTSRGKFFWSALVLLFLSTIMLTMSRGGFLGIAATLLVCWAKSERKAIGLVALVLAVGAVALLAPSRYFEEIRSIQQTDEGTAHKRREYWMAGIRMFAEKPLLGVGPGNSKNFMSQYVDLPHAYQQWGRAMHGTLPLLLAEMGAVGFLIYTVLGAQSGADLAALRRRRFEHEEEKRFADYVRNAVAASAVGFLVTSTFLSALYYPHIYLLAALAAVGRRAVGPLPARAP